MKVERNLNYCITDNKNGCTFMYIPVWKRYSESVAVMEMSILISILIINILLLFIINILISSYTLPQNISSVIDLLENKNVLIFYFEMHYCSKFFLQKIISSGSMHYTDQRWQ